jgi:hypothetical protein
VRLSRADQSGGDDVETGVALADAAGKFSFEALAAGRFRLVADEMLLGTGARTEGARLDDLDLADGTTIDGVELRVRPGAGVTVVVTDSALRPIARALVLAAGPDGQPIGSVPIAFTDAEGRAFFAALPAGPTRIVARDDRHAPAWSPVHDLVAGERREIALALPTGTDVLLEALDERGQPLSGATIRIRFGDGPWVPAAWSGASTDGSGRAQVGRLAPGRCEFAVEHPRRSFRTARHIPAGSRATLVLQ